MLKQGVGFCLFCAAEKVWPPGSGCSTRAAAHQHTRHVLLHTRHVHRVGIPPRAAAVTPHG